MVRAFLNYRAMKRIKTTIKDKHAIALGLSLNKSKQYRIDKDQHAALKLLRGDKEAQTVVNHTLSDHNLPTAWNSDESRFYEAEEYCKIYGLDSTNITYSRLVVHQKGHMVYNLTRKHNYTPEEIDVLAELEKALKDIPVFKPSVIPNNPRQGVAHLADLHFGALVTQTKINPHFSPEILASMLSQVSQRVNNLNFDIVHVHLLGDLIESFTGLMHKNQWKQIAPGMYGVRVVKAFVEMFKTHFLDLIDNLGKIKIVAGNHDRTSSDKNEDTEGGAADMVAYCLELLEYDVEYSPTVLVHTVDDITYILNHGHHFLTKKMTTKELCWQYGVKGNFNFVCEGHLHSRIEKMTANRVQAFQLVSDDSLDSRRMVFPALFPGNDYSERGGWSSNPGFVVTESNGNKRPILYDFPV